MEFSFKLVNEKYCLPYQKTKDVAAIKHCITDTRTLNFEGTQDGYNAPTAASPSGAP